MASDVEVDFLEVLESWLNANRPADLPLTVTVEKGNSGKVLPLKILKESSAEPETRPCIVLVVEDVEMRHPRLAVLSFGIDTAYVVDDFSEKTVSGWQRQLSKVFRDRETFIPAMCQAMADYETDWSFRDIKPSNGGSEVQGKRSRGLSDLWSVWLMRK